MTKTSIFLLRRNNQKKEKKKIEINDTHLDNLKS